MLHHPVFAFIAALVFSAAAHAHSYQLQDLHIDHPYARTTVPHQPSGAAYLTIENKGNTADKLVALSAPIAKTVEIHTMSMDGNVMRMREMQDIALKPSAKVVMQPGNGYHLMLLGLSTPLKAGDKFPMTLTFEKAGKAQVTVVVEGHHANAAKEKEQHHSH